MVIRGYQLRLPNSKGIILRPRLNNKHFVRKGHVQRGLRARLALNTKLLGVGKLGSLPHMCTIVGFGPKSDSISSPNEIQIQIREKSKIAFWNFAFSDGSRIHLATSLYFARHDQTRSHPSLSLSRDVCLDETRCHVATTELPHTMHASPTLIGHYTTKCPSQGLGCRFVSGLA